MQVPLLAQGPAEVLGQRSSTAMLQFALNVKTSGEGGGGSRAAFATKTGYLSDDCVTFRSPELHICCLLV